MQQLALSENQLSGSIPTEIGSLVNLTHLHLNNNQLSGEIDPNLLSLPCRNVKISNNYLTPSSLIPPHWEQENAWITQAPFEWIPRNVNKLLGSSSILNDMNEEAIRRGLCAGTLPCAFSPDLAWPAIHQHTKRHEQARRELQQLLGQLEEQHEQVEMQCQQLEEQLTEAKQRKMHLEDRIEQEMRRVPPMRNLSALLELASRVVPIEQDMVGKLEEELRKSSQLAALSNEVSPKPKLSLLLNCMGLEVAAIAATSDMDSATFKRHTRAELFSSSLRSELSDMVIKDLMYCAEMMRNEAFPFSEHVDACQLCRHQSPAQLIEFIQGLDGVDLPSETLTAKDINGRRIVFCTSDDFPDAPQEDTRKALEHLQYIHFDVLDQQRQRRLARSSR